MLVSFSDLPGTSRVWVYQSSRQLSDEEVGNIQHAAENFIGSWTAHQAGLKAGVLIAHHFFIVIGVDENYNDASGCSIDKKVNFIKQLGADLSVDFFDRMKIAYLENNEVKTMPVHQLTDAVKSGRMDPHTIIFNNLVTHKSEFLDKWNTPIEESWISQLIAH